MKKKGNNGGGSRFLYVVVICLAILLGCLASSAQCKYTPCIFNLVLLIKLRTNLCVLIICVVYIQKKVMRNAKKFTGRSDQLLEKVGRTRGVFLTGTAGNTSAYHSEIECPSAVVAAGDEESKVKLIFCTVKCYCHGVHGDAICYCCQKPPGPVCYDKLADCRAHCPICQPECPPATTTEEEGQHLDATTNAT